MGVQRGAVTQPQIDGGHPGAQGQQRLRRRQRDKSHRAVEGAALGGEDSGNTQSAGAEFAIGGLRHHHHLFAQAHTQALGQLAADQDVAVRATGQRLAFDQRAVDEGDLAFDLGHDAHQQDAFGFGRAAGQRLRLHPRRRRRHLGRRAQLLQQRLRPVKRQLGRVVLPKASALHLHVAGDVAGGVLDQLLAKPVEVAEQKNKGDDAKRRAAGGDGGAPAVAQDVARGDQQKHRPGPPRCVAPRCPRGA
ncbi:hypothetical protein D9M68_732560 [compost metagenome]